MFLILDFCFLSGLFFNPNRVEESLFGQRWKGVGWGFGTAEQPLETTLYASAHRRHATAVVYHTHLAVVASAEFVKTLQLLDRHTGVVKPTIAPHVAALLLLDVVERVAMEVADRGGDHFGDKRLVVVDEAFDMVLRLRPSCRREQQEEHEGREICAEYLQGG